MAHDLHSRDDAAGNGAGLDTGICLSSGAAGPDATPVWLAFLGAVVVMAAMFAAAALIP